MWNVQFVVIVLSLRLFPLAFSCNSVWCWLCECIPSSAELITCCIWGFYKVFVSFFNAFGIFCPRLCKLEKKTGINLIESLSILWNWVDHNCQRYIFSEFNMFVKFLAYFLCNLWSACVVGMITNLNACRWCLLHMMLYMHCNNNNNNLLYYNRWQTATIDMYNITQRTSSSTQAFA